MASIREKYFKAMRRETEDYVPFEFSLSPSLYEIFQQRTGAERIDEYFQFPVRGVGPKYIGPTDRFTGYLPAAPNVWVDPEWGIGHEKGTLEHFERMLPPMKDFQTVDEFAAYPYPDAQADYDWDSVNTRVQAIKARDLVAVGGMQWTIFELAWYLRGMETFLIDLVDRADLAAYHLDRITTIRAASARRFAMAGVDVLSLGDDVSTQLAMMMRPATWRTFIKPRLAEVIRAAKEVRPEILIFYHGDGNLQAIIPDLIEVGVEILNPVQPECMDPVVIKQQYGDRLSLWGTIGTQTTMPFGTPAEVRATCQKMIREVGRGGGLGLAPTHVLEPEVPWENVQAFVDAVRSYNESGHV
jgi:uroporphyrinogen decarboxylase